MLQKCFPGAFAALPPKTKNEQECYKNAFWSQFLVLGRFRVSISASGRVQGLIFCFWGGSGSHFLVWDGSGSHFLLLGRFRVLISVSGKVQGLIFCFWEGSGSYFLLLGRFRV